MTQTLNHKALILLVCALLLASCGPIRDVQRIVRGQQLKHTDVMPTWVGDYIAAAGLGTTTAIMYVDPANGLARSVTDRGTIVRVLNLLGGDKPRIVAAGAAPQQPLTFTLTLDPPERVITMTYVPGSDRIALYNIPTVEWPEHYVGSYQVRPEFGGALMEILGASGTVDPK